MCTAVYTIAGWGITINVDTAKCELAASCNGNVARVNAVAQGFGTNLPSPIQEVCSHREARLRGDVIPVEILDRVYRGWLASPLVVEVLLS